MIQLHFNVRKAIETQDFTAICVRHANMEGFHEASHKYAIHVRIVYVHSVAYVHMYVCR